MITAVAAGHILVSSLPGVEVVMTEAIVEVPVSPTFVLNESEYNVDGVSYDPATNVLIVQWDRNLAQQQRRLVFPAVVGGHAIEVAILRAPREGVAEVRAATVALPALYHGEDCDADLTFFEPDPPSPAAKLPKFKITVTIRGRPKGAG